MKPGFHSALSVTHISQASNRAASAQLPKAKQTKQKRKSLAIVDLILKSAISSGGEIEEDPSGINGAVGFRASYLFNQSRASVTSVIHRASV